MTPPSPITLTGRKRSGKDTAAKHLIDHHGYARIAFADPIKRILSNLNPYLDGTRLSGTFADAPEAARLVEAYTAALPRWTGIAPLAIEVFAALDALDPCIDGVMRLRDLLRQVGDDWDQIKEGTQAASAERIAEVRRLQQHLGTESVRAVHGDSTWTDVALHWTQKEHRRGNPVVITDCRFDVEARAVRAAGGLVVAIERPDLSGAFDGHSSEAGVSADLIDHVVVNDGTLADLHARIEQLVREAAST